MKRATLFPLFLPSFLVALSVSAPAPARAQDDPRRAEADVYFQEGLKLHDAGREAEALEKFKKARAIYPSPNALYLVARSEHLLSRFLDAIRDYREAAKSPLLHPKNAQLAKQFIAELEQKLARVELVGPAGTKCLVAGVTVVLPTAEAVDVEPGTVTVEGTAGDTKYEGQGVARSGQTARIELKAFAKVEPGARVEPGATEPPPTGSDPTFWTTGHTIGVALAGLAVVGVGFGVGFAVSRENHVARENDIASSNPLACVDPEAAPCRDFKDAADGAKSAQTLGVVSFAAAGALGVGAAILLWPRGGGAAARAHVVPNGRGLSVVGSF